MDLKKILPTDGPPVEEVLKYVEKYKNEIIVIKYGGNVFIDRKIFDNFIKDLSVLSKLGLQVVVVHGGGPRIKRELSKQNIESKFIRGLRVTNEKIVNILRLYDIELVILAGYMQIVHEVLFNEFHTINIHPSLLPKYSGLMDMDVHNSVIKNGDRFSGCTLHMVTNKVDGGRILLQSQHRLEENETAET